MTETEINIAIAKACGWTDIMVCPGFACTEVFPRGKFNGTFSPLPNYCRDLNAMAEAEKSLEDTMTNDQWSRYCSILNELCCPIKCGVTHCGWTVAAPARQRAESFLRTLSLWKEEA